MALVSAGAMVSVTRLDLPEPETPVTTVNVPNSIFAVTFLRLLARAPVMVSAPRPGRRRSAGSSTMRAPARYLRVSESGHAMISSGVPAHTTRPPFSPAPGPMSIT